MHSDEAPSKDVSGRPAVRAGLESVDEHEAARALLISQAISKVGVGQSRASHVGADLRALLSEAGICLSERQCDRLSARHRLGAVPSVVDQRKTPRQRSRISVDPRLYQLLSDELDNQLGKSTGTRGRVLKRVEWRADEAGVPLPSRSTMYRLIKDLDQGTSAFASADTRERQANRPNRTYSPAHPARPGELVEVDSTPLDVLAIRPDGSVGRPELTYAIDVATNTICGSILLPRSTKGADLTAVLLARILLPIHLHPGWESSLATLRAALPQVEDIAAKYGRAAERAPVITPESVTVDRGRVFIGRTFMAACERLQISVNIAAPGTPTGKPHVEGGFARIRSQFVQYLNGYTGGSVADRGRDAERDAVWTVTELQILFDAWVALEWQVKPQSGLRIRGMAARALSPNEMFDILSADAPQARVQWAEDDYISMLPMTWRSVQPYGVNLNGLTYDSDALHPFRGRRSGLTGSARDRWEVRFDPSDTSRVWVLDHVRGRWLEARWVLAGTAASPFSATQVRAARRAIAGSPSRVDVDIMREIEKAQRSRTQRGDEEKRLRPPVRLVVSPPGPPKTENTATNDDVSPIPLRLLD